MCRSAGARARGRGVGSLGTARTVDGGADGPAILSIPPPPAPAGGGGAVVATWASALQSEVSTAGAGGWGFLRMDAGQILPQ